MPSVVGLSAEPRRSRVAAAAEAAVGELEDDLRECGGEMGVDEEVPANAHSSR